LTLNNTVHRGKCLPRHLQVAFGRGVFRLCHTQLTHGLVYLRDLPLNLDTLSRQGFPHALAAYRSECARVQVNPVI
jgi:hypothetical protein